MTHPRADPSGFVHLHVRSAHSHLFGASRSDELVRTAAALGYHDLALTDRDGLYGAVAFYQVAREAGLRPIVGLELMQPAASAGRGGAPCRAAAFPGRRGRRDDPQDPSAVTLSEAKGLAVQPANRQRPRRDSSAPPVRVRTGQAGPQNDNMRGGRAVLLARNLAGYRTLCRLATARHLDPHFDLAGALAEDHEHIYILVPHPRLLADLAGRVPDGRLFALVEEFGDRSTRLANDGLARAASRRKIPLAAGGAVAFHAPGRFAAHRTLRAIALRTTVTEIPRSELAHPGAHLKGPGEMAALFRRYPEAVANTVRIAADCRLDLPLGRPAFPKADVPSGETAYSHLAKRAFAGLKRRYRPLRPEAVRRLERELAVIDQLGFADYFLIMDGIAAWARGRDIPCVARGSAAGSLVAWCLGLSGVDPLAYGLLFERFLNLERADVPDIDLDICWRRRDEVIGHVVDTYGPGRVAMISTHQRFQARSAFRETAKAHGLPPDEVDRLSHRLPYASAAGIRDAVVSFPELRDFPVHREDIAHILEVAAAIDALPRHLSVHVGGLVIADRPLTDYLPLQVAAKGVVITQPEAEAVEALGLVKMDLLAQRSLSIIQTAVAAIEKNHGIRVDPEKFADGDPAAEALLARGDTFGCFQIESPGMRNLLRQMRARRRMDVILGLSLIRPGPASSGMKERFVRRRRGLEPAEYLHPALRDVLGDTYGVMLYQEDVIRVAHAAAGFTLAEGDRLRKDLAKGADDAVLGAWRTRFVRGCIGRGARRDDAQTLWDRVAQFAAYSYCKAHACTYGEISYRAVVLRARWPAEFAAAVLANNAGYYERRTYLEDARRRGCPVLGPHVNASAVEAATEWVEVEADDSPRCHSERAERAKNLALRTSNGHGQGEILRPASGPQNDSLKQPARRVAVRLGLADVRGLSARTMRALVEAREAGGPYRSVADLLARVLLSKDEAEHLALAGAMDGLARNRPQALWQVHALAASPRPAGPLLAGTGPAEPPPCPDLPDYPLARKVELEAHLLGGMTPTAHPMTISDLGFPWPFVRAGLPEPRSVRGQALRISELTTNGQVVTVAGLLFAERRARTRTGEFMKFISLEDPTGTVEAVLLPDAYQRLGGRITTRGPYLVTGTVEEHFGAVSLIVSDLRLLAAAPPAPADAAR
ncbi:MAG: DNA polymerase III subunit alpha [Planctomycetes bacterium]|nr:DNA polymerase III subunit alpha [Planctomycetota bacterium]